MKQVEQLSATIRASINNRIINKSYLSAYTDYTVINIKNLKKRTKN